MIPSCQKLAGERRGGIRERVIFFSAIEKGKVRKKLARSFYISDINLKEPGEGSRYFNLLLGEGHYISVTPFTISPPLPPANI